MATLSLTWKDFNLNEDGFNIYRSETPMDVNNMPAPIATVGANIGSYDDTTGVNGTTYYYRVGAVRGSEEKISPELTRNFNTYTGDNHDVFGDSSAVLTYSFNDQTSNDLGGNYNGYWADYLGNSDPSVEQYAMLGVGSVAAKFDSASSSGLIIPNTAFSGLSSLSVSIWAKRSMPLSELVYGERILEIRVTQEIIISPAIEGNIFYTNGSWKVPNTYPNDTGWNHFCITYDATTNEWDFYINGEVELSVVENSIAGGKSLNYIGVGSGTGYNFDGLVDQVRVFNRKITASEVGFLYAEEYDKK